VEDVIGRVAGQNTRRKVRLVKGSHIIVKKFWDGPHAYLLQNHDKRVIFVNPYEEDLCLIGTTDIPYEGRAEDVAIDASETDYLLQAVNRYARVPLRREDVLASFSGVRPLYDDNSANPSAVTRDYVFDLEGEPPLLSVFGGKITTYRKLAEQALNKLKPHFPAMGNDWTASSSLPGGDLPEADFEAFHAKFRRRHSWMPAAVSAHYARLYGSKALELVGDAVSMADLGKHFGGTLYEREIQYLRENEWAATAADVLDRRTKHGLHLSRTERQAVEAFLNG
jgi:glycerol-3-phosphate dehydrogenase